MTALYDSIFYYLLSFEQPSAASFVALKACMNWYLAGIDLCGLTWYLHTCGVTKACGIDSNPTACVAQPSCIVALRFWLVVEQPFLRTAPSCG